MSSPLRLLINGASGRMGLAVARLAALQPQRFRIVAVVSRTSSVDRPSALEADAASLAPGRLHDAPAFDAAIDFSLPPAFDAVLELCRARAAALVSGTTGLHATQRGAMQAAAASTALLWSPNFSIGVAVLQRIVAQAAVALPDWDCDIVESHHTHKKDAPSGTALALGAAAAAGGADPRYASLRAGDIVGEHLVQFTGLGERVELIHRATDRDVFARGALHAARWLSGRAPGLYSMQDLLAEPVVNAP